MGYPGLYGVSRREARSVCLTPGPVIRGACSPDAQFSPPERVREYIPRLRVPPGESRRWLLRPRCPQLCSGAAEPFSLPPASKNRRPLIDSPLLKVDHPCRGRRSSGARQQRDPWSPELHPSGNHPQGGVGAQPACLVSREPASVGLAKKRTGSRNWLVAIPRPCWPACWGARSRPFKRGCGGSS